jgi:hypothetical protein
MNPDNIDYQAVRRQVEAQMQRQKRGGRITFAVVSVLLFILFSTIVITMLFYRGENLSNTTVGALAMLWAGWLTTIIFHIISPLLDTKSAEDNMRERLIARAIGAQLLRQPETEPGEKRKHTFALSDDGEIEVVEPQDAQDADRQRAQRR